MSEQDQYGNHTHEGTAVAPVEIAPTPAAAPAGISLLDVKVKNTTLEIIDPIIHEPMGLSIDLLSPSDSRLQGISKRFTRKIRDAMMRRKPTDALEEERDIEYLSTAVVGWRWNNAKLGGTTPLTPIPFTPENVRAVLAAKQLGFIRDQINEKMAEDGDFLVI